jgi:hypothetical protein
VTSTTFPFSKRALPEDEFSVAGMISAGLAEDPVEQKQGNPG